jgi:hypothetical protein
VLAYAQLRWNTRACVMYRTHHAEQAASRLHSIVVRPAPHYSSIYRLTPSTIGLLFWVSAAVSVCQRHLPFSAAAVINFNPTWHATFFQLLQHTYTDPHAFASLAASSCLVLQRYCLRLWWSAMSIRLAPGADATWCAWCQSLQRCCALIKTC